MCGNQYREPSPSPPPLTTRGAGISPDTPPPSPLPRPILLLGYCYWHDKPLFCIPLLLCFLPLTTHNILSRKHIPMRILTTLILPTFKKARRDIFFSVSPPNLEYNHCSYQIHVLHSTLINFNFTPTWQYNDY